MRKKIFNLHWLTILILLTSGCQTIPYNSADDCILQYEIPPKSEVSPPILLIADNQETLEYRGGNFETSTGVGDFLSLTSASRPRALTLWSTLIVQEIAQREPETTVLLHLGDVLNNSCSYEWEHASAALNGTKKEWYLVPGNHDGFYFGLTHPLPKKEAGIGPLNEFEGWRAACVPLNTRISDEGKSLRELTSNDDIAVLQKDQFIIKYLSELRNRKIPIPQDTSCYCGSIDHSTLKDICFEVNHTEPWKSYIIQHLVLRGTAPQNPIHIIATDTSAFDYQPKLLPPLLPIPSDNAFDPVNLRPVVLKVTRNWLEKFSKKDTVFLAGHHPFYKFKNGRKELLQIWQDGRFDAYLSGDTHDGLVQRYPGNESNSLLEVNLGSTLDAPIEYRILKSYQKNMGATEFQTKRTFLTPPWRPAMDNTQRLPNRTEVFQTCKQESICTSQEASSAGVRSFPDAFGALTRDKGYATRRDILLDEATLYKDIAEKFKLELSWDHSPSPIKCNNCACDFAKASSLKNALYKLTGDTLAATGCWPDEEKGQILVLAQMSKILVEGSITLEKAITESEHAELIKEYKVCSALNASCKLEKKIYPKQEE